MVYLFKKGKFMKPKISLILLLGFFTRSLWAQSINVEYGFNIYALNMNDKEITFQKKEYVAKVTKEECSTKLFNDYKQRLSILTKETPKDQTTGSEFLVKYKIDAKSGTLTPSHPFAQVLLSIPKTFDVFKLATEFRCQKDKK